VNGREVHDVEREGDEGENNDLGMKSERLSLKEIENIRNNPIYTIAHF
jgi:hypothetical protein